MPAQRKSFNVPPAKPPPPVPPAKAVPVSPQLNEAARREVETALHSNDTLLRIFAVETMQEVNRPDWHDDIALALSDPEAPVRFAAAMAAGELKLAQTRQQLLQMVDDPSPSVRVGVRFALHRLGDTSRSHDLEKYALDPTPRVRRHTALALGLLGDKSGLNVLRPMRTDPDAGVRQQVAEAMWRLGDESALDELVGLTLSSAPDDQMFALLALAAPKVGRVRGVLRGKLTDDYLRTSLVAARAMGMLGSDEGYGVALNGAKSQDKEERFLAARAFAAIGRPDAQPALEGLLKDVAPEVRLAAASAVLQLKQG
jgi:HEAT repeat protein